MCAGRDPVDRVIDVVVAVPLCSLVFARRAAPIAARAGGRQARRLIERAARSPVVSVLQADTPPVTASTNARTSMGEHGADPAVVTGGEAHGGEAGTDGGIVLPIDAYDHLAARQVCDRLPSLTPAELQLVAGYERAHRGRRTILGKIEQLTT
jgi:hypothetical protein